MSVPDKNAQAKSALAPRTASRVAAVQALYQMEIAGTDINAVIDEFVRLRFPCAPGDEAAAGADASYFSEVLRGVVRRQRDIDPLVDQQLAEGWRLVRVDAILRAILRAGVFDVLVGINLLREGLDLPEVSLVGILDADKEGFLRSTGSLIQTMGRAARHIHGKAILYADRVTASMRGAIDETDRRRNKQLAYNATHGITPRGVVKALKEIIDGVHAVPRGNATGARREFIEAMEEGAEYTGLAPGALAKLLTRLEKEMYTHARNLEFERAAALRDKIRLLRERNFRLIGGQAGD